jgi:hypothetical protein
MILTPWTVHVVYCPLALHGLPIPIPIPPPTVGRQLRIGRG